MSSEVGTSKVGTGKKVARFVVAAMVGIALIVTGTLLAPVLTNYIPLFGTHSESRNTEVIQSITREEQVVLLSLGIEGIEQKDQTGTSWFNDLPFTGRSKIIQYGFKAKLGIEGKDVAIKETGTGTYLVSIPKFIFIGHDNVSFKSAFEKNGALIPPNKSLGASTSSPRTACIVKSVTCRHQLHRWGTICFGANILLNQKVKILKVPKTPRTHKTARGKQL